MKPDYKKVIKFLKRVKPSEQKVLNALKIFDKGTRNSRQFHHYQWKWVCYYKMVDLLERPENKDKSMNEVAINFCKSKTYISFARQMDMGLKGDVFNKARMVREHYSAIKKLMDKTRKELKTKRR